ncbi:Fumarate lyase [Macleaya cordata]|uniref:Fumarate lyase n=1 Tax=Macleaya cordata TaxID=56857 RepID=A0A200QLB0_MACCD|nr:Fumarate lyase [Macleaya cordata]
MAVGASARVSNGTQPSRFIRKISNCRRLTKLHGSYLASNSFFLSCKSFPQSRAFSCSASVKDNPKPVLSEMRRTSVEDPNAFELSSLTALSTLDGRYWEKVKDLAHFMSECGLIRFRILFEIKWLIKLSQIPEVTEVSSFSEEALCFLEGVIEGFSMSDALEKCQSHPEIAKVLEFFHFACTSEDINNLAHALMLKGALNTVMLPVIDELIRALYKMGKDNSHILMLSRTHGQPAMPTTLGKEMATFASRLSRERHHISQVALLGKFAGAVRNYNAHLVAYPDINWPRVAEEFVKSLGLNFNPYVTQIEPHDCMVKLFFAIIQFDIILMDFDSDIWGYISVSYFKQITKAGEIGSSTMPHKVNPIDFENSEGNLGKSNAGLSHLSMKLPISCWQVNEARLSEDLDQSWEVLAEPIQTVLNFLSRDKTSFTMFSNFGLLFTLIDIYTVYEKLKELTRGRAVMQESIRELIIGLELPEDAKANLLNLTPHTYIGAAVNLAKNVDMFVDLVNGNNAL